MNRNLKSPSMHITFNEEVTNITNINDMTPNALIDSESKAEIASSLIIEENFEDGPERQGDSEINLD